MEQPSSQTCAILALAVVLEILSPGSVHAAQAGARTPSMSQPKSSEDLISPDRPGIADGSSVIARGLLQIEIGFQREFREESGTRTRTSFLPALLRLGLGARWEGRLETNAYSWTETENPTGTTRLSGWSPASFGLKYQIRDADDIRRPSLGLIGRVFPPSGSGEFSSNRFAGDLRLAVDLDVSTTLSLNPNVGIGRYEDGSGNIFTATLLAATLTFLASHRVMPFVDVGFQKPVEIDGPGSLLFDAGLAYIIGRNVQLDVSLGTGGHGPAPHPFFSFGISLRTSR
jgi:hypothetical protein